MAHSIKHDVVELQVTVDDALGMEIPQTKQNFSCDELDLRVPIVPSARQHSAADDTGVCEFVS